MTIYRDSSEGRALSRRSAGSCVLSGRAKAGPAPRVSAWARSREKGRAGNCIRTLDNPQNIAHRSDLACPGIKLDNKQQKEVG